MDQLPVRAASLWGFTKSRSCYLFCPSEASVADPPVSFCIVKWPITLNIFSRAVPLRWMKSSVHAFPIIFHFTVELLGTCVLFSSASIACLLELHGQSKSFEVELLGILSYELVLVMIPFTQIRSGRVLSFLKPSCCTWWPKTILIYHL